MNSMKKIKSIVIFFLIVATAMAQTNTSENKDVTATLKSSSRLFKVKEDLTSVILVIPSGSVVTVLDSDSTYFHVTYQQDEGYIYKRHAVIDKAPVKTINSALAVKSTQETPPQQEQYVSRFTYLESKYGTSLAARLNAGKIWKGMSSEMVKDSWGKAEKVNRVINGNVINEEWIYKNSWLYFENNTLVEWGPRKK
jgi:hypothetical protein